ncbi:phosphoglycolate phosphatase [Mesorhizobium sp. BAC0120]|uniref:phosphoglycolate phosphatase n=1 Tax=Mesorhizobium sp. BAC0120 TaxID=3090670 RepID=UPI00298D21EF|nr:phosphoglycolate phosphatase [Mesorhizobium sp. BAC0120]MDW6024645.1 phosphoglycolate phosphatase [Mesorhizobium sp. BAC0120]
MNGFVHEEPHWPRAVLFDLDGTLIDSVPDIRAAVNELLARRGLGPLPLDQVKSMIGNGVQKLVERAFAATTESLSPAELQDEYMAMLDIYAKHLTGLTTLMPGVRGALDALHGEGVRLGLVTNKPQRFIETILDHFRLAHFFGTVIGGDAGVAKKPAPDMLLAALDQFGAKPWDAVMVGDSVSDVKAARAAGTFAIIVRGGYTVVPVEQLGADVVIDSFRQLGGVLPTLKPAA